MGEPPVAVNVRVKHLRARNIGSFAEWLDLPETEYVGRKVRYVDGTYDSKWGNYKRLEPAMYAADLERHHPELVAALGELTGKKLGCWCVPDQPCHAEQLVRLWKKKIGREEKVNS